MTQIVTTPDTSPTPVQPPSQVTPSPISVRNLTISYDGKPAIRSITFDVPANHIVGIIGPNGAGKSTLLKSILGLIPTDGGQVQIFGQPVKQARQKIAYVPQTEAVDWDFPVTVMDVVLMGRYCGRSVFAWPGRRDKQLAIEALDKVGMTEFAKRHIRQLSGGQQKRVFLARALCQESQILLLDEPFAGVDAATEKAIFDLMANLTRDNKTLVVVNHDLSVLHRFDELLMINQRLIAFGPTKEVATEKNFHITYGGRLSLLDQADTLLREIK